MAANIQKIYRKLDRYGQRLANILFRLRYGHIITIGQGARVYKGVRLFPHWNKERDGLIKLKLGINAKIGRFTHMYIGGQIEIGDNSTCGDFCYFGANGHLAIGKDVLIGPYVRIIDTDHEYSKMDIPINRQGASTSEITIDDDVWIGSGATILKGVAIGKGAVIAAGAVVTRNVPENAVAAGIPARVIKMRGATK